MVGAATMEGGVKAGEEIIRRGAGAGGIIAFFWGFFSTSTRDTKSDRDLKLQKNFPPQRQICEEQAILKPMILKALVAVFIQKELNGN